MKEKIINADDVNYFKTSKTAPDTWLQKAKGEIEDLGGNVHSELIGTMNGRAAIMLGFVLDNDNYRIVYPVLIPRNTKDDLAAKRQAATALYHEVKALCVSAKFRGVRGAFHSFLLLPDGRTAGDLTAPEVAEAIPVAFRLPSPRE
jgi:hypothetical protein